MSSGIGAGDDATMGNNVCIYGGTVTATAGTDADGIGNGHRMIWNDPDLEYDVVIENAKVTAAGGHDSEITQLKVGNGISCRILYVKNSTVKAEGRVAIKASGYGLGDNMRVNDAAENDRNRVLGNKTNIHIRPCNHEPYGNTPVTYTNQGEEHMINCYYCMGQSEAHTYAFNPTAGYFFEKCYAQKPEEPMVDVVVATYNETQNAYQATNYLVSPGTEYALPIGSNLSAYGLRGVGGRSRPFIVRQSSHAFKRRGFASLIS